LFPSGPTSWPEASGTSEDLLDSAHEGSPEPRQQARQRAGYEHREKVLAAVVRAPPSSILSSLEEELTDLIAHLEVRLRSQKLSLADYMKIQKKTGTGDTRPGSLRLEPGSNAARDLRGG
jgi:phosphoribosyl-ATP pyrophosphohydrolase